MSPEMMARFQRGKTTSSYLSESRVVPFLSDNMAIGKCSVWLISSLELNSPLSVISVIYLGLLILPFMSLSWDTTLSRGMGLDIDYRHISGEVKSTSGRSWCFCLFSVWEGGGWVMEIYTSGIYWHSFWGKEGRYLKAITLGYFCTCVIWNFYELCVK